MTNEEFIKIQKRLGWSNEKMAVSLGVRREHVVHMRADPSLPSHQRVTKTIELLLKFYLDNRC